MVASKPTAVCMYCGQLTRRGHKGEHILPEAIGGTRYLNEVPNRTVCTECNCGVLSQIDRELCSRSYLSVIASGDGETAREETDVHSSIRE